MKNYRPVCNLSFLSNVTEKIVLSQLSAYLNADNLFPTSQSAYRPGHSTETALLKMMDSILHALDNGHVTVVTLLDLSAAFDTIDHNIVCQRLEHLAGISGTPLNWFRSYLSNRTQTVTINNKLLRPILLNFGDSARLYPGTHSIHFVHKILLHSFTNTPFLSQTSPSCTIPAVQIE